MNALARYGFGETLLRASARMPAFFVEHEGFGRSVFATHKKDAFVGERDRGVLLIRVKDGGVWLHDVCWMGMKRGDVFEEVEGGFHIMSFWRFGLYSGCRMVI